MNMAGEMMEGRERTEWNGNFSEHIFYVAFYFFEYIIES